MKNKLQNIKAEREILVKSENPWIVELICTFQDDQHLYLVMEYLPGGDLMGLLIKKDKFTEEEGRFYMAEAVFYIFTSDISRRISSCYELYSS